MNRVKSVNKVFLATVLISLLGSYINNWIMEYTNEYFVLILVSQLLLVIPSIAYLTINRLNVVKVIRFNKIKMSNVILIIVFSYLITPLMNFINAISMMFVQNDTTDVMKNIIDNNGLWLSLFLVAFIPCVLEETVYRGIFYNEYSKVSPLKGILLSGFLFGIIHGNLNQFSYAFAMGIVFALLIEATNSILATMIVHFFINGSSILIMALYPKVFAMLETLYGSEKFNAKELTDAVNGGAVETMNFTFIVQNYGLTALVGTILAFIVYKAIAKNSDRWEYVKGIFRRNASTYTSTQTSTELTKESVLYEIPTNKKPRLLTWSLRIGIFICVTLMLLNEEYINNVMYHLVQWFNTSVTH